MLLVVTSAHWFPVDILSHCSVIRLLVHRSRSLNLWWLDLCPRWVCWRRSNSSEAPQEVVCSIQGWIENYQNQPRRQLTSISSRWFLRGADWYDCCPPRTPLFPRRVLLAIAFQVMPLIQRVCASTAHRTTLCRQLLEVARTRVSK